METIVGGKWLPRQDLAWRLIEGAVERVRELENELGCFFDRNPDGSLHQKAFAGQSFDRTVHKGDLTGIEIINRLMEQVWARSEEHTSELQSLMGISYAVFCFKKKKKIKLTHTTSTHINTTDQKKKKKKIENINTVVSPRHNHNTK